MRNKFQVGAVGRHVEIGNLPRDPELTPQEALELAAYLVITAAPLMKEPGAAVLGRFHKMVVDLGDAETSAAAAAELEE